LPRSSSASVIGILCSVSMVTLAFTNPATAVVGMPALIRPAATWLSATDLSDLTDPDLGDNTRDGDDLLDESRDDVFDLRAAGGDPWALGTKGWY
jgi:hypothetical protein